MRRCWLGIPGSSIALSRLWVAVVAQAEAGVMSFTGEPQGYPMRYANFSTAPNIG